MSHCTVHLLLKSLSFSLSLSLFVNVRAVLQGACHMVAMQLASEPLVRQALRQVYQTRAVINVSPTKKGRKVINIHCH